ncbi:hypothetical protein EDM56_02840 [Brevibacillus fluminis]|uniref:Cell wall hydrolase SleB domain-containing protein n=1 Tax=Brevibacillus fluminis TaxID=511487 RepID=A0A3M8DW27_9BACL|nr:cell wall hydrolase [Brevibacillus fluminis]RNB91709.1 hypothetical protein EDM56_02840 [Brevibacillus fluminis]
MNRFTITKRRYAILATLVVLLTLVWLVTPTEAQAPLAAAPQVKKITNTAELQKDIENMGFFQGETDIKGKSAALTPVKTVAAVPPKQQNAPKGEADKGSAKQGKRESFNPTELDLLSRLIYMESRGEPYKGKVAVGAVALNRVESKHFPKTLKGVIMAPGAFSVVHHGKLANRTNEESRQAAMDALRGVDPTNGALYFYNPRIAEDHWIFSRPTAIKIGHHVFAY